jgi:hypothetical protein
MGQILEVRLQDGTTTPIDSDTVAGTTAETTSTSAASGVVDTGFAPGDGEGAYVLMNACGYDPTGNLVAGVTYGIALRKSGAGTLAIAGHNAIQAALGDGGLTGDVAITFSVSMENTLVLNFATTPYANPVSWIAVLQTGAST